MEVLQGDQASKTLKPTASPPRQGVSQHVALEHKKDVQTFGNKVHFFLHVVTRNRNISVLIWLYKPKQLNIDTPYSPKLVGKTI